MVFGKNTDFDKIKQNKNVIMQRLNDNIINGGIRNGLQLL